MQKKLTITLDADVYDRLHRRVGPDGISRFIEDLVRPHVTDQSLLADYAGMGANEVRERQATAWSDALLPDADDEEG
jgi:predicted CopG family antitoxin